MPALASFSLDKSPAAAPGLRVALLRGAFAQVERGGHRSVSISALARGLGVTQPAAYRHFASRDALLQEVAIMAFDRLHSRHRAVVDSAPEAQRLDVMAASYVQNGLDHPGLYRLVYSSHAVERSAPDGVLHQALERAFQWWLGAFGETVAGATRERVAHQLWVSLHGVVMLTMQGILSLKMRRIEEACLVEAFVADARRQLAAATHR